MTIAQLIDILRPFDPDAQVFGDDGTRFVVVEREDEISYSKNAVYIRTWRNIDHEEYLKDEVDAFMMACHGWDADTALKVITDGLMNHGIWNEMNHHERVFLKNYARKEISKEHIEELEAYKEHLRDLIKQCDNKIAELTKGGSEDV